MIAHYRMFAAYNTWANNHLYAAAAELDEAQYNRNAGAFFGSMNGTLNHILGADRIWMKRFTGKGEHPDRLDAVLHPKLRELREARIAEDARIAAWIEAIEDASLAGRISYKTIAGQMEITQRLGPAVAHFFNHQTQHRGQAHTILSILGKNPPSLDLLLFYRSEEGKAWA